MTDPIRRAPATATLLSKIKREAKRQAKATSISYTQALESGATAAGYATFHELQLACASPASRELPLDPPLRAMFDQTPNERRSKRELDTWWDRPFAVTNPGHGFDIRCLDGGAWDRSTWYMTVKTLDGAYELAQAKLARWREFRAAPVTAMVEGGGVDVVRMPQHPRDDYTVLYHAKDFADAAAWIAQSKGQVVGESSAVSSNSESGKGAG